MQFTTLELFVASLLPLTNAFPSAILEAAAKDPTLLARTEQLAKRQAGADAATSLFEPVPIFNAEAQYINVTKGSGHEYVAPGPNDLRGPCPGLNALANHKFLPHNGYATVSQYVSAVTTVTGMGPLLALSLSQYGANFDGNVLAWSMGGKPSLAQGGVTGILADGLIGSHNNYETDGSPTRPDLYQAGNNYELVTSQFQELVDYAEDGEVTMDSLTAFRAHRFDTQVQSNPEFFYGPFSGLLVQPAAYTFIYRFMANHSAEAPAGTLNLDVLKSWFGVQGESGNYKAVQGTERIPENWYRRAIEYPYENVYFVADVLAAGALHPQFLSVGGNTGTPDSFTGVDVADLTGGLFSTSTLAQGNNFACFVYQLAAQAKPDIVGGLLDALSDVVNKLVGGLGCPKLGKIEKEQLEKYPGYMKKQAY